MEQGKDSAKNRIKQSFCDLLRHKSYEDLTISDIVRNAGVARVTFYRVYGGIDDVLTSVVQECYEILRNEVFVHLAAREFDKLYEPIYRMMIAIRDDQWQYSVLRVLHVSVVAGKLEAYIYKKHKNDARNYTDKYMIASQCGIIIAILHTWCYTEYVESPEVMAAMIVDLLEKTR